MPPTPTAEAATGAATSTLLEQPFQQLAVLPRTLWLPALAQSWLGAHRQTLATLAGLQARLAATHAGFAGLLVDEQLPAIAPPPVALAPG